MAGKEKRRGGFAAPAEKRKFITKVCKGYEEKLDFISAAASRPSKSYPV